MWTISYLVPMCYAHGYGEFGNQPTPRYIALCHYLWRWLSTLGSKVWTKKLCLFATNITEYFGCDCMTCYFLCAKGFTFKNLVIGGLKWSNMDGPCAQLCTMSSFQCGWQNWPILSRGFYWPMMYVVWAIFKSHYYVDFWSIFSKLAHGMFHATSGRNAN